MIEIDITSPSLNKFPILAAMGVLEVWRFDGAQIDLFRLSEGKYVKVDQSTALPDVTSEVINHLLEASKTLKRTDWLRLVANQAQEGPRHRAGFSLSRHLLPAKPVDGRRLQVDILPCLAWPFDRP